MKKITGILFVLLFFTTANLFASIRIDLTSPTLTGSNPTVVSTLQAALNVGIQNFETELNTGELSKLQSQDKMATSFGTAVGYAAQSSSIAGYQGYDLFAIMLGAAVGVQLPTLSLNPQEMGDDIETDITRDKDASIGMGVSASANLGINITPLKDMAGLKSVFPNRMYLNLKYFSLERDLGDLSFETTTFGLGLNYQLIDRGGDQAKFFKWSGLSVGTGFLYNTNKIKMSFDFDEESFEIPLDTYTATASFTPNINFGLDITSYIIPVDISTSLRLLWMFNFTLGAGLDFMFGESKIIANASSPLGLDLGDASGVVSVSQPGRATIDAGTTGGPSFANFRVTAGVGICLGPLPIDVKVNYYVFDDGLSLAISTGIVW